MNTQDTELKIVTFEPQYQEAFKQLNVEWISTFFEMEDSDYKMLDNPQTYVIDKGGEIFVALLNNEAVGVCALVKSSEPEFDFELAKMAVNPKIQGKGVGFHLGKSLLEWAKEHQAKRIFLDSNTSLKPAIHLYEKLGFVEVEIGETPYKRCDIRMVVEL